MIAGILFFAVSFPPPQPVSANQSTLPPNPIGLTIASNQKSAPDFDREVLIPLRAKQAADKAATDLAAQKAAAVQAAQAAYDLQQQQSAAQTTYAAPAAPSVPKMAYPTGGGSSKINIYTRESGNNPAARNGGGCLGLGQACPGSKLTAVCPNLDYGCEDSFFTDYANSRYGGWDNAWAFWQSHNWW